MSVWGRIEGELEEQLFAALKENADLTHKSGALCGVLGNLAIHIRELGLRDVGEMGEWRFRNERAETAEATLSLRDEEIARLREQLLWIRDEVQMFGKSANLPVVVSRASRALKESELARLKGESR